MHSVEVSLVAWPCGCVLPFGNAIRSSWHMAYACSWCDAEFSRPDLLTWFRCGSPIVLPIGIYRQLVSVSDTDPLVEIVGVAIDGEPIVRERYNGAVPRLIGVPSEEVQVLRN